MPALVRSRLRERQVSAVSLANRSYRSRPGRAHPGHPAYLDWFSKADIGTTGLHSRLVLPAPVPLR